MSKSLNAKINEIQHKLKMNRKLHKQEKNRFKMLNRFYSGNSLLGNYWAIFYLLVATGDTGKSYWAMKHIVSAKLRNPKKYKLYWTRLTDTACKRLLADNAKNLLDPDLYRRFGKDLKTKGNTVYYGHYETVIKKNGKEVHEWHKEGELCQVHPLSTFYNNKGEALFDNEFDGEYYIILDEMNRESAEANRFSIVEAFTNQLENFCRDYKGVIRVICIGNNMDEMSDILGAFNFIPKTFGRFKLRRRRAVIEVIEPSDSYKEDRAGSVGALLNPNAGRFRELHYPDEELVAKKHLSRTRKPAQILAFGKETSEWFTLNKNSIITQYNGEKKPIYAMQRHLKYIFDQSFINNIIDMYDHKQYMVDHYATQVKFKTAMRKIKSK